MCGSRRASGGRDWRRAPARGPARCGVDPARAISTNSVGSSTVGRKMPSATATSTRSEIFKSGRRDEMFCRAATSASSSIQIRLAPVRRCAAGGVRRMRRGRATRRRTRFLCRALRPRFAPKEDRASSLRIAARIAVHLAVPLAERRRAIRCRWGRQREWLASRRRVEVQVVPPASRWLAAAVR